MHAHVHEANQNSASGRVLKGRLHVGNTCACMHHICAMVR